jgi:hypothetical protein
MLAAKKIWARVLHLNEKTKQIWLSWTSPIFCWDRHAARIGRGGSRGEAHVADGSGSREAWGIERGGVGLGQSVGPLGPSDGSLSHHTR